jgi:hypothetical protein
MLYFVNENGWPHVHPRDTLLKKFVNFEGIVQSHL